MDSVLHRILDMAEKSVIMQGVITLMITGTVCYMSIIQQPIHDGIWQAFFLSWGFFFGSKLTLSRRRD